MKILKDDLAPYTPRKEQSDALDFIKSHFDNNEITKFFLLDLPVGVGKSMLAFYIVEYYLQNVNKKANFDILTNSRILQEQYTKDFNTPSNLWGKQNYRCDQFNCSCKEGKEFAKLNKTKCEDCPYDNARDGYMKSKVNLTNFHLYILLNLFQEDMMDQREKNVLIIDESHEYEKVFSDFISITLSEKILKKLGFKNWKNIGRTIKSINNIEDFAPFIESFEDEVRSVRAQLVIDSNRKKSERVSILKKITDIDTLITKIERFQTDYERMPENWCLEWEIVDKVKKIKAMPVWVHPYLEEHVWSKYDHVFLMSGTILDKKLFTYINGIPEKLSTYYSIDSPFDVKNRPIYYFPVSKMNYKNKENAFVQYKPFIKKILSKYGNKKGIIHSVTYELAKWVETHIENERFIFHSSDDKDKALQKHNMMMDSPTILVSPSMMTGVNLEYDKARFQIMLKVPYPPLNSLRNKLRMNMNEDYYPWLTVCSIIQAYGRGVRSYDDQCDFIMLDACFSDVMNYSSRFIPGYIMDAVKTVVRK